jgi:hypothetical protein
LLCSTADEVPCSVGDELLNSSGGGGGGAMSVVQEKNIAMQSIAVANEGKRLAFIANSYGWL